jgi:hypothetical protein
MEILQISIRRLSVVNATDATDSSGGPSHMLFEDQDRVLPHAMESRCRKEQAGICCPIDRTASDVKKQASRFESYRL